jgi:hypothetical protein
MSFRSFSRYVQHGGNVAADQILGGVGLGVAADLHEAVAIWAMRGLIGGRGGLSNTTLSEIAIL